MFEKLLVTTDLSEASRNLLKCLKDFKELGAKKATIIHILDVVDVGGLYPSLLKLIKPKLEEMKQFLENLNYESDIIVSLGNPAREINRIAVENNYSAIIAGTHGESLMKDVLLGSVVHKIIIVAKKPVLLIPFDILAEKKEDKCKTLCNKMFSEVLFPTDFSETAEKAFSYLQYIIQNTKPKVTFCHIQDIKKIEPYLTDKIEEFNKTDFERLSKLESVAASLGATETAKILKTGHPTKEIADIANSGKYTSVVMGSQGRSFIGETYLGKVTNYAVHHIDIPILIIPPDFRLKGV
jgi:nucleotide-binding universal stress UspA family protein